MRRWTIGLGALGAIASLVIACGAKVAPPEGGGSGAAAPDLGAACKDSHLLGKMIGVCSDGGAHVTIDTTEYSHACKRASDCVPIFSGKYTCGECSCPNAAIQATDEERYKADMQEGIRTTCGDKEAPVCHCPNIAAPTCNDGVCAL